MINFYLMSFVYNNNLSQSTGTLKGFFCGVADAQELHALDEVLHSHEDVPVNHTRELLFAVKLRVSRSMDDPHLLDESGLATLPRAWNRL